MNSTPALPHPIALYRQCVLAGYYSLIAFFFVSTPLMLGGISFGTLSISALQTLPLLIFAPGLQRTRLRTYGWLSFVVQLYFVHGVLVAFRPGQMLQGSIEVALTVGVFVALILFIRTFRELYKTPL